MRNMVAPELLECASTLAQCIGNDLPGTDVIFGILVLKANLNVETLLRVTIEIACGGSSFDNDGATPLQFCNISIILTIPIVLYTRLRVPIRECKMKGVRNECSPQPWKSEKGAVVGRMIERNDGG